MLKTIHSKYDENRDFSHSVGKLKLYNYIKQHQLNRLVKPEVY
jgi:hypothetical protein